MNFLSSTRPTYFTLSFHGMFSPSTTMFFLGRSFLFVKLMAWVLLGVIFSLRLLYHSATISVALWSKNVAKFSFLSYVRIVRSSAYRAIMDPSVFGVSAVPLNSKS